MTYSDQIGIFAQSNRHTHTEQNPKILRQTEVTAIYRTRTLTNFENIAKKIMDQFNVTKGTAPWEIVLLL